MSNVAVVCRVALLCAVSLGLSGCFLGSSSDNNGEGQPVEDAGESMDTEDSTQDSGVEEDSMSEEDSGQHQDTVSTEDTVEAEDTSQDTAQSEDTSEPEDTGDPFQRDCSSGPLDAPIDGCAPAPLPTTGDPYEDCVRRINQFRWECQCLPPLERWHEGEQCADEQAAYDEETGQYHAGFSEGICSPRGSAQNECPGYGTWDRVIGTCLQQMWDEGPGEPFSEHGHYINMSSTQYTKVACGAGDTWFVQNFQ